MDEATRQRLVKELMQARRAVRDARMSDDGAALKTAREAVNAAKIALGERGPTWWDGDADLNRKLVKNTTYAEWFDSLADS
ncbi:hypothetical protein [Roseimaritima ulvae]|nr:hypothetical protein [Roseimaritima ulvae]